MRRESSKGAVKNAVVRPGSENATLVYNNIDEGSFQQSGSPAEGLVVSGCSIDCQRTTLNPD